MPVIKSPRQPAASDGPWEIESVRGPRRRRQRGKADPQRNQAERQIDGEKPRPGAECKDARCNGRSERESGRHHQRIMTEAAAQQPARIDEADQRRVHAHQPTGAESLQRPRHQQARQRPRQGTADGRQREQEQPAEIDALVADDFAECAERQQCRDQRDLVDIDDPDHFGRADVQIGGDGGQGDVGDGGVERGHRQRGKDRGHRPSPTLRGQTVHNRRGRGFYGCIHVVTRLRAGAIAMAPRAACTTVAPRPTAAGLHDAYADSPPARGISAADFRLAFRPPPDRLGLPCMAAATNDGAGERKRICTDRRAGAVRPSVAPAREFAGACWLACGSRRCWRSSPFWSSIRS